MKVGARFLQMPFENVEHVEISELEKIGSLERIDVI